MERLYNYQRSYKLSRRGGNLIDLGDAGSFREIILNNRVPPEETVIGGRSFTSFHIINMPAGERIFTAFKSEEEPAVLLIVWGGIPFHLHIEEGGDLMLQAMYMDGRLKHLIIDNTYVRSLWMREEKTVEYMENGWLPGLVQLGLRGMCHLQPERLLGKLSFEEFGKFQSASIERIAARLGKEAFHYFPIRTSETLANGGFDAHKRDMAMTKALEILRSI
jgi:hypothetical protein